MAEKVHLTGGVGETPIGEAKRRAKVARAALRAENWEVLTPAQKLEAVRVVLIHLLNVEFRGRDE
ncbi:MAG: hypothetical protein H6673_15705 [Anaerolineales bacterium]|nr:hypothetical protein [Anaerolineales bacterium]